ncbi:MAG: hypothetical protein EOO51_09270 [Flavobacterium sp.]|nr:MAG: hypothetical protein EOO51_09270 [Flavobacterium sp.]
MEDISEKYKHIPGWGYDADPRNNPTYPMKNYTGADHDRLDYEREPQQPVDIEVLKSIERPELSRVFGTSAPPSGLSGMLRRFAFRFSESTYLRWFPLVVADRINVVEGYLDDFAHGTLPNPIAERGLQAEWKYNRRTVIRNVIIGAAVTAAVVYMIKKEKEKRRILPAWSE